MKKVLITGANSYIGTSFENFVVSDNNYVVDTVDLLDDNWKEFDFSGYDSVYHVSGIAHIKEKPELEELYYKVNRDLVIEVAKKAKKSGVKQFIFLSTMSVYGINSGVITPKVKPNPATYYGKSKFQAENTLNEMREKSFKVVIVRPPMVYGKACKGNFQTLVKLANVLPIFPLVKNERSMIHIDNLSSFVKFAINNDLDGLYMPQNKEYVNTSEMERIIANSLGKKIYISRLLAPFVPIMIKFIGKAEKAFGTLIYKDTEVFAYSYCIKGFEQSVKESI